MNVLKGSLIGLVAFCAGFVAAMCAEPYLPGRAQAYRQQVEALAKENDYLQSQVRSDNAIGLVVPKSESPVKSATSPRSEESDEQRRS